MTDSTDLISNDEKQRTSHLIRSRECEPAEMGETFPRGVFHDYFISKEEAYYLPEIDLDKIHSELLRINLVGEFSEQKFYAELRCILQVYGFSVRKSTVRMRKTSCGNHLAFGGIWDYKNIGIYVYLDRKRPKDNRIKITPEIWKQYCYDIVGTIAHEIIHVAQTSVCENGDIYNYHVIDRPKGLKKSHYDELNYLFEPAEIEAMTFEAIIQERKDDIPRMITEPFFQIGRARDNMIKYQMQEINTFDKNIKHSLNFWNRFVNGKN